LLRNTRKRDKTKEVEEKLTSKCLSILLGFGKWEGFCTCTWTFCQNISVVFLNSPWQALAEKRPKRQKRTKNKAKKKEVGRWVGGSGI
jgi:hypothetical protein